MPPPNITGKLHLGHAAFLSIQDSLIRYYRKQGYSTLWLPGTDHAGIATHEKIIESLEKNYSSEAYQKKGLELKNSNHSKITEQIKRTGASCDWEREQYTLNDNFKYAAKTALQKIDEAGLLYTKNNQWYINMTAMSQDLLGHIEKGQLRINDQAELNQLIHMLENPEDWCISRQIEWGYSLPIFKDEKGKYCITDNEQEAQSLLNTTAIYPEHSTFDTWFTSSLWPFASLGWPQQTEDYLKFYPAQMIETASDILFFWCARMLMMGKFLTGIYPFEEIYLHGIFRDKQGQKMSKSLGNGIDPLDIIDQYGADTLRFGLLSKSSNKDTKIDINEFRDTQKFINKIWQSARFFDMQINKHSLTPQDYMIDSQFNDTEMKCLEERFFIAMERRDFLNITRELQYSFKHYFCDTWIEQNKSLIWEGDKHAIQQGLNLLFFYLNLLHCFIPYISEFISMYFFEISLINQNY